MRLSREVRFAMTPPGESAVSNSWSGWPSTNRIVPRISLVTTLEGQPDALSGYICDIQVIDQLIRSTLANTVIPQIGKSLTAEQLLRSIFDRCETNWPTEFIEAASTVEMVEQMLVVTPQLRFSIRKEDPAMVSLTQQFEFSASHRLHNPELSEQENKTLFGKCNNPNGHGHNYVIEVTLNTVPKGEAAGVNLASFESKVKELVVDRLDHKHLNRDVEYFANVNPSVENIAIAIWNWLAGQFGDHQLANVRVFETPKTWADYSG